ncbi:MAG: hypothetical protein KGM24_05185 [Elusimicrobia bacterium]|nr:hypothetical protein [Elusimicrobiota bacterium]
MPPALERRSALSIAWHGLAPTIVNLVTNWEPGKLSSEKQYRDSLFHHLENSLPQPPQCRIEREYRDAGTTTDVFIKWNGVFGATEFHFELKNNLTRKTDFDRLVGQISILLHEKRRVIVVLCGKTDSALLGRLKVQFEDALATDGDIFGTGLVEARMILLTKDYGAI